jgi:hypothetical protein
VGVYAGPDSSESGLVLSLDAGNLKSYGGSGTTWTDLSGLGNTGTLVNGVGYSSANKGSLSFDGVNDYVSVGNITGVTNFTNTNNYTVDFWFYPNAIQSNTQNEDNDVIEKWSGTNGFPYVFRYLRATQTMQIAAYNGTSSNATTIQISHSKWWNICGVFNWTSSSLIIYGNAGAVSNSVALNLTGDITNNSNLNLMFRGNGLNYTTGNLSSLKIYNRALSASEISQNFNATRGRYGI